jgi:GxxExxY protein
MQNVHQLKYAELTGKIIGCAMRVHSYFGPGFPEIIYHRALIIELNKLQLEVESEVELGVMYYDAFVGKRRVDLIIDRKILIELKALAQIDLEAYNQVLNCLNVFNLEVGLLFNFGKGKLEFKRFVRMLK